MNNGRLQNLLDFSSKTSTYPEVPQVNPRRFNDPIALECSWDQLDYSNRNFATHILKKSGDHKLEYKPNISIKVLGIFTLLVGFTLSLSYTTKVIDNLTALFSGSIFLIAGIYITIKNLKPEGFDKDSQMFYRGYSFQSQSDRTRGGKKLPFDQIQAVQLLPKIGALKVGSDVYMANEYFPAFELNLVTKDSDRVFVMTYINQQTALHDADQIAQMVEVPLWSALPK